MALDRRDECGLGRGIGLEGDGPRGLLESQSVLGASQTSRKREFAPLVVELSSSHPGWRPGNLVGNVD